MRTHDLVLTAAAVVLPAIALAQMRSQRSIPPFIVQRFDKDGDGKLNAQERSAFEKARQERSRSQSRRRFDGAEPAPPGVALEKEAVRNRKRGVGVAICFAGLLTRLSSETAFAQITLYARNPFYWRYGGRPILLFGGRLEEIGRGRVVDPARQ